MAFDSTLLRVMLQLSATSRSTTNALFLYGPTGDSAATVAGSGYFAGVGRQDPQGSQGIVPGDIVMRVGTDNGISFHRCSSLSTSTGYGSRINATCLLGNST